MEKCSQDTSKCKKFQGFPPSELKWGLDARRYLIKIIRKLKDEIKNATENSSNKSQTEEVKSRRYPKRNISQKYYKEEEIPSDDDYLYCDDCEREWEGDCPVHGPLVFIPDKRVPCKKGIGTDTCFAMKTLPDQFEVAPSQIKSAGLGVWTREPIPKRMCFGPYLGMIVPQPNKDGYCWQITRNRRPLHYVDAGNPSKSNWMRYVNCARYEEEQNIMAYQFKGAIYYRTVRRLEKSVELLVWYGDEYGLTLGISSKEFRQNSKSRRNDVLKESKNGKEMTSVSEKENTQDEMYPSKKLNAAATSPEYLERLPKRTHPESYGNTKKIANADVKPVKKRAKILVNDYDSRNDSRSSGPEKVDAGKIDVNEGTGGKSPEERIYVIPVGKTDVNGVQSSVNALRRVRIKRLSAGADLGGSGREKTKGEKVSEKDRKGKREYFRCNDCGMYFGKKDVLIRHLGMHGYVVNGECNSEESHFKVNTNVNCGSKGKTSNSHENELKLKMSGGVKGDGGVSKYVCDSCGKGFNYISDIKRHLRVHRGEKAFPCDIRDNSFSVKFSLNRHKLAHTGEKRYICEVCGKRFTRNSSLKRHRRTHTGEKPFKCGVCDMRFTEKSNLIKHRRTHTGEKPFKCEICDMKFTQNSSLITHIRVHSGEKPFKCEICDMKFTQNSSLISHRRVHSGEKPFKCGVCDMRFTEKSNLIKHRRTHTGEKPFKCEICDMKFTQNSSLITHRRVHSGEKPFKCEICDMKFTQNIHLKRHRRTHTGEKPFKCGVCDMRFTEKSNLIKHRRTHTGEKPFKCEICDMKFTQNSSLITHIRVHSGEKPYKCEICDMRFTQNSSLIRHKRIHSGEKPYKCEECKKCYSDRRDLIKHLRIHSGEKP